MYRAFLFDLDGTLIDSAPDICRVASQALAAVGRAPLPLEVIRGFVGDGLPALVRRALNYSDKRPLDSAPSDPREHQQATAAAQRAYLETPVADTTLYPEAHEILYALSKRAGLGLVTNKPYQITAKILATFALTDLFRIILGGDSLPQRKPDPAPVRHALSAIGVAPIEALFIGDHQNDLLSARGAGVPVALALYGYTPRAELEALAPEHLIESLSPLLSM